MKMKRSQERELALRGIFSLAFHDEAEGRAAVDRFLEDEKNEPTEDSVPGESKGYAKALIDAVIENFEPLDGLIAHYLRDDWTLDRLPNAEKAILRMSIAEMLYLGLDYEIAINEAVELAKKYGEDGSWKYVNGILNHCADDYMKKPEKDEA